MRDEIRKLRDGRTVIILEHRLIGGEDYYRVRIYGALKMDVFEIHSSELKPRMRKRNKGETK